ncbi:MAG: deiodinase-related protein, partial [Pseudomonadota bacterium]|nr:deiodinase-related protein [Pseudomonadota bacterium]
EKKYAGWPERLYVIGSHGNIAYAGDMGPMGFDPDSWESAIRQLILTGSE